MFTKEINSQENHPPKALYKIILRSHISLHIGKKNGAHKSIDLNFHEVLGGFFSHFSPLLCKYFWISSQKGGVSIRGYSGPLPNDFIFCRWTALHVYFILVYLCSRTIVVVFELELLKSGWGNSVCWRKAICRLFFVLWCLSKDCNLQ